MKQFSNISTLIFDFGGVIINLDMSLCIQNFKNLGVDDVEQYLSNFGQKEFFLQFEKGQIGTSEFRDEIRKLSRRTLSDKEIDDAWCSFLRDIPVEKLELLLKLRKRYRLLALSNTNPLHIETIAAAEFAKAGKGKTIHDFFDKCYFSYEMGMTKPDVEIFEALLKDAGVKPEQCLFLDDGAKNIDTASKLGIQTYLVGEKENLDFLLNID
ncbi:MAG: HAD family phosphatase [Bacteroidales bacterium]|nr:HAD family phosphatase [Bacteroidales bacterium]